MEVLGEYAEDVEVIRVEEVEVIRVEVLKKSFAHSVVFGHGVGFVHQVEVEEM